MKSIFKTSLLSILLFIGTLSLHAQVLTGQILDEKTKEAIPYVNIGIPSQGIGTVSDVDGNFSLKLDDKYNAELLKISMIGYKPIGLKIQDVKNQYGNSPAKFYMAENSYELSEVIIRPVNYKTKIVGNKDLGQPCVYFIGDTASANENAEVGTLIKIKKRRTYIDNISFGVCHNDFDSLTIRVNIYTKTNENVLKRPIYVKIKKADKAVSIDTKQYNIYVEDDFIIAFEALEILRDKNNKSAKKFAFSGGLFGADMLIRRNIYDKWKKVAVAVVGFNATITYED